MTTLRWASCFVLLLSVGCRATLVVPARIADHSDDLKVALAAVSQVRLDEAERIAASLEKTAPAESALVRLYIAERRHDAAAVHVLATGPAGDLLRADRFRLTALARVRYWTEGLEAAKDDLHLACDAKGEPDLGTAHNNVCALAAQADELKGRVRNEVDPTPGESSLVANQSSLVGSATVNGKGPAFFIVDTGAPTTVLARRVADKRKFPYRADVRELSTDGGGNPVVLNPAILDRIGVGRATVNNAACHIMDLPEAFHVAGILAPQQAFPGAAIEFDLRARILRVLPGQSAENWASVVGEPTHVVPVLWADGNMFVPVRILERAAWLLFDTGADRSYLCNDIADALGAKAALASQEKTRTFTAAGTVEIQEGFEASLAVGDAAAQPTQFRVKPCARNLPWLNPTPPMLGAGYLGASWLEGRRVLLSGDGRWIVFTDPASSQPTPLPPSS